MAQILLAKADGKRWTALTFIGVYPDTDDLEKSFPSTLYRIVKVKWTPQQILDYLSSHFAAGDLNQIFKRLKADGLTAADLTNLANTTNQTTLKNILYKLAVI